MMSDDENLICVDQSENESRKGVNLRKRKSETIRERSFSQPNKREKPSTSRVDIITVEDDNIHTKLDIILKKMLSFEKVIQKIENSITELKEEMITSANPVSNEIKLDEIKCTVSEIKTIVDNNTLLTSDTIPVATMSNIDTPIQLPNNAPVFNLIPNWESKIKQRKFAYFKFLHNDGRLKIHKGWQEQEVVFIPPRFLPPKLSYTESEAEYSIRKREKDFQLQAYLDLLMVRSNEGKASYETLDAEIITIIDAANLTEVQKADVKLEYHKRITAEENVSVKKWEKSKKGIVESPQRAETRKVIDVGDRRYSTTLKKGLTQDVTKEEGTWTLVKPRHRPLKPQIQYNSYAQPVLLYPDIHQPPPRFTTQMNTTNIPFQVEKKPYKWKSHPHRR